MTAANDAEALRDSRGAAGLRIGGSPLTPTPPITVDRVVEGGVTDRIEAVDWIGIVAANRIVQGVANWFAPECTRSAS